MPKYSLSLLLLVSSLVAFAQVDSTAKGHLLVFVEPIETTVIRVDTMLVRSSQKPLELSPGRHVVKAWAPKKQLFIDTLSLKPGQTAFVTRRLKNSPAYDHYKRQMESYRLQKFGTQILPPLITVGYSLSAYLKYKKTDKEMAEHFANAQDAQTKYETAISVANLTRYKDTYETEKENYETCRVANNKLAKQSTIIVPVAVVATAALQILARRITKPVYQEEAPLLTLNAVYLDADPRLGYSAGLVFNLNR
ncbi:MAG: hypothetical protein ACJ77K_14630 [Bacteroidia bacterium]